MAVERGGGAGGEEGWAVGERESEASVFRVSCGACWTVALALLFAGVTTGDAYLFDRLGGFSGGVSLDEPLLPASSNSKYSK